MIDLNKTYTCKIGHQVILDTSDGYYVFGRTREHARQSWLHRRWSANDGKHTHMSAYDLVEVPATKPAISKKHFIIIKSNEHESLSGSTKPHKHFTIEDAIKEASRLSAIEPNCDFIIYEAIKAVGRLPIPAAIIEDI